MFRQPPTHKCSVPFFLIRQPLELRLCNNNNAGGGHWVVILIEYRMMIIVEIGWWIHRDSLYCSVYFVYAWNFPWIKSYRWTSLVAQWLRICLPMQRTRVRALVWEDPTCRGATKPVHHNYWACSLESMSHNCWARVPQLLKPSCLEPVLCNKRSHRNKPAHRNEE